jgi:hypothetical protein
MTMKSLPQHATPAARLVAPVLLCVLVFSSPGSSSTSALDSGLPRLTASDTPNDEGTSITLTWDASKEPGDLELYQVFRSEGAAEFKLIGEIARGNGSFVDENAHEGVAYRYFLRAVSVRGRSDSALTDPVTPRAQWFNTDRVNVLAVASAFSLVVLWYIRRARRGEKLYIRMIPGLEAVDDAVGRATEMGRPLLYIPGIGTVSDVSTLASLTILSRVAKRAAEHETRLLVPCTDPLVMPTAQEVVQAAYREAGRPDLYREGDVAYLTYDQFGYAAGVDGMILRERPGAIFLQGYFAAESLILAETGHSVGAIQIAGTDQTSQLPFLVPACDYTLIGEELYAASSYLSREPVMLGTIKAEDLFKMVILVLLAAGAILGTTGLVSPTVQQWFQALSGWLATGG